MKLNILLQLFALGLVSASETYPKIEANSASTPYKKSDLINDLQCIERQIDTGEHKFDADNNIMYGLFPVCIETGEPLALNYGVNNRFNCTFMLTDEIYHLFQLYIHEDSPFSCKAHDHKGKTGGLIPLTFNFRGNLESSHLDIDNKLNIIGTYDKEKGSIGSLIGYSSGSTTSKFIIGDKFSLEINQVWFEIEDESFYTVLNDKSISLSTILFIGGISSLITSIFVIWLLYGKLSKKALKLQHKEVESKYD